MDTLKTFREHVKKMSGNGHTLVIPKSFYEYDFVPTFRKACREISAGRTLMEWHIYYEANTHPYLKEKLCEAILENCPYAKIKEVENVSTDDIQMMEMMLSARSNRIRFDKAVIEKMVP